MSLPSSRVGSLGMWAWMAGSIAFAFFFVLVVLDLPLCTKSACDGWRGVLGSTLVCALGVGLAAGGPLAWWRVRRVGGRP